MLGAHAIAWAFLLCALLSLTASVAQAAPDWGVGMQPTLPSDAYSTASTRLLSVSCPAAGDCAAVGFYSATAGHVEGLIVDETNGVWSTGQQAQLPAGASINPGAHLTSVSCAAPGDCSAVGYYTDSAGAEQGLLLTETGGVWTAGQELQVPSSAGSNPDVVLLSVSCSAPGYCSAVGHYDDNANYTQGVTITQTAGTWAPSERVVPPANAQQNPNAFVYSVSCSGAGDCSAVGSYTDHLANVQALLLTQTNGSWTSTWAMLPSGAGVNPRAAADAVSCTAPGDCSAGGSYADSSSHTQAMLLTQTAGTWATAVKATLPGNAYANPAAYLASISCTAPGDCTAVGHYLISATAFDGVMLTENAGAWAPGVESKAPVAGANVDLTSVSCASAGNCTAVGVETAGNHAALMLSESGGSWATGVEAQLPGGQASPQAVLYSVSCPTADDCAAVGDYKVGTASLEGLIVAAPASSTPSVTPGSTPGSTSGSTSGSAPGSASGSAPAGPDIGTRGGGAAGTLRLGRVKVRGSVVSVSLRCVGPATATCSASLALAVTEKRRAGHVVALSAKRRSGSKLRRVSVTLASARVVLHGGQSRTLRLTLHNAGKGLIARFHRITARLVVREARTLIASRKVVLPSRPGKKRRH